MSDPVNYATSDFRCAGPCDCCDRPNYDCLSCDDTGFDDVMKRWCYCAAGDVKRARIAAGEEPTP